MDGISPFDPAYVTDDLLSSLGDSTPEAPDKAVTPDNTSEPKLTKNEFKTIKRRVHVAENYAQKEFLPGAERALRMWQGNQYKDSDTLSSKPRITINYTLPTVETMVDSIAFAEPDFYEEALDPKSVIPAKVGLAALKYYWHQTDVLKQAKYCEWHKEVFGFGVAYIGWEQITTDFKLVGGAEPVKGEEGETTPDPLAVNDEAIEEATIIESRPFVKALDSRQFLIDPGCGQDIDEARYMGYWEVWALAEVKSDRRFKNTRNLKGTARTFKGYLDPQWEQHADQDMPSDTKYVRLMHYYEKRRRLHVIFTEESEQPLIVERWDWEHGRYPFRVLHGPCAPSDFYGVSIPLLIEDAQREINETRSDLSLHRKRAARKLVTTAGNLSPLAKRALKSGEDLALIETNGTAPLTPIPPITIQEEVYRSDQWAKTDINVMTHVSSYETQTPPTFRKTNDEVHAIQAGGGACQQAAAAEFEHFLEGIARDYLDLMMQYSQKVRMLPIYDDETNAKSWVGFKGDYIRGDYNVRIYVGSTQPDNDTDKVHAISFLLQSLAPFYTPQNGMPVLIDPRPLLTQLLQSVPYIKNVQAILAPSLHLGQQHGPPPGAPPQGALPPSPALPAPPPPQPAPGMQGVPPELPAIVHILTTLPEPALQQILQALVQLTQPGPAAGLPAAGPPLPPGAPLPATGF